MRKKENELEHDDGYQDKLGERLSKREGKKREALLRATKIIGMLDDMRTKNEQLGREENQTTRNKWREEE